MFVCLSVRLLTFEVPFKRLYAPTSRSRISNNFRDSESLRKSIVKKWSHIWKLLLIKGKFRLNYSLIIKSTLHGSGGYTISIRRLYNKDQKVIQQGPGGYTTRMRRLLAGFFWYQCYYLHRSRAALSPVCRIFLSQKQFTLVHSVPVPVSSSLNYL